MRRFLTIQIFRPERDVGKEEVYIPLLRSYAWLIVCFRRIDQDITPEASPELEELPSLAELLEPVKSPIRRR